MATLNELKDYSEPKEILPGLHRIRLPQPKYGSVYVHLASGGDGPLTLFDSGLPHEMTQNALSAQLEKLGKNLKDIDQIVYTHSHVDHMGGGYVISGAAPSVAHVAHRHCIGLCEDFISYNRNSSSWKSLVTHLRYAPAIFEQVGRFIPMDAAAREKLFSGKVDPDSAETDYHSFAGGGSPISFSRGLRDGDIVSTGRYKWEVVETPGHNPHHLVFIESQSRASITGDIILDHGTPIMRSMGDNVTTYLDSLARLSERELGVVLPSHGRIFEMGNQALKRVMVQREFLLQWVWDELKKGPASLLDLSFAAIRAGVAGEKTNPILLAGVLESALYSWCEDGIAIFDPGTGRFDAISDCPRTAVQE